MAIEAKQAKYAKECLEKLDAELGKIKKAKNRGMNIFDAVGMSSQEVKHSAFLSFLLNPTSSPVLGNTFLTLFLNKLFTHPVADEANPAEKSNAQILAERGILQINDFADFISDACLTVETEKVLSDNESRMDIFISSEKSKTLLVIENKTFTSTHDEQLTRYEKLFEGFVGWKKIFVYLTPKGVAPKDNGIYRGNWCVFGYRAITEIIRELLPRMSASGGGRKLKLLMEDYADMVDTNILKNNKELKNLCKRIRREHKDAVELLLAYTDNTEHVFSHCAKWLKDNLHEIIVLKETKACFDFYTVAVAEFFERQNENISIDGKKVKCRFCLSQDGEISGGICLDKERDGAWSNAQLAIAKTCEPNKPLGNMYFSLKSFETELLDENGRELDFENVKPALEANLKRYAEQLQQFQTIINNI